MKLDGGTNKWLGDFAKGGNGVRLFDADTVRERPPRDVPTGTRVAGMTFSPTSERIAAGSLLPDSGDELHVALASSGWDNGHGRCSELPG